ncbi:MAG: hypothetical protein P4L57_10295 [Rhizomicrobium sp.]|nr:hypothetical protein [Rhizomicrobium sp.]
MAPKTKTSNGKATAKRIAISLSKDEAKKVTEVAERFAMKDAGFAAYCVRFYLSHHGDKASLMPLPKNAQLGLEV